MRGGVGSRAARRRGVVVMFVALMLVGVVGMAAISVDGGLLYLKLRQARATADATAMAAACSLYENYPTNQGLDPKGTAATAATTAAAANGVTGDKVNSELTVNIPPQT